MTYLSKSMQDSRSRSNRKAIEKRKTENFGELALIEHTHRMTGNTPVKRKSKSNSKPPLKNYRALKQRKCKVCSVKFTRARPLQNTCSVPCALKLGRQLIEKQETVKWKGIKENLKTLTWYENKLQAEVNKLARLIDYGQKCISCNRSGKPQAGHRHSIGANRTLRFNLHNLHFQDYRCNVELSGNIGKYDVGLTEIYSPEYHDYVVYDLVKNHPLLKWSKEELQTATQKTRTILKTFEPKIILPKERIELRSKYNDLIGIYK